MYPLSSFKYTDIFTHLPWVYEVESVAEPNANQACFHFSGNLNGLGVNHIFVPIKINRSEVFSS